MLATICFPEIRSYDMMKKWLEKSSSEEEWKRDVKISEHEIWYESDTPLPFCTFHEHFVLDSFSSRPYMIVVGPIWKWARQDDVISLALLLEIWKIFGSELNLGKIIAI